jgi:hypothetical protein
MVQGPPALLTEDPRTRQEPKMPPPSPRKLMLCGPP